MVFSFTRSKPAESSRRSIFVKMMTSNFFLLLIPIALWFSLYLNIEKYMITDAKNANSAMLEQLRINMDRNFEEVAELSEQIVLNPKLHYILENSGHDRSQHFPLVQFMRDYLMPYSSLLHNSFMYDFYISLNNSDYIMKPGLTSDARSFYEYYYHFDHLSYDEWQEQLRSYHGQEYYPTANLRISNSFKDEPVKVITFMQSLPIGNLTNIKGNLTILIDEEKIHDMTRHIELANQSSIYLVSQNFDVISSTQDAQPLPAALLNEMKMNSGFFNYTLNEQSVIVSYTSSDQFGWYYIAIIPEELYLKKMKEVKRFSFVALILFLLLGSYAAYKIAYYNYSPIKKVIEALSARSIKPKQVEMNELDFIMEMVNVSWNEEKDIKNKLNQQLPILRSNYLHRLLHGYIEPDDQKTQSFQFLEISFPYPHFAVVLVEIDSLSRFTNNPSEKQWALARFIISNLAVDAIYDYHMIHAIELKRERLALIVNLTAEHIEDQRCHIQTIVSKLHHMVEDRFKLDTSFAVSQIHSSIEQISEAYIEAAAALEYKLVNESLSIFYFHTIRNEQLLYQYPVETEFQLINCIRGGDSDKVVQLLNDLFDKNLRNETVAPELRRCLLFSLAGTLLRILNSDSTSLKKFSEQDMNPVQQLLSCRTTDEMYLKTKELYLIVTDSFRSERSDHNEQLLQQIQNYIDTHYADPNMSLNLLAEHLQITPQYISQVFKKISGFNFSNYLTAVRLSHAKKLMENSQLTNSQIASMVGYTSDAVFIRVFKKVEGLTPGKYRESTASSSNKS